MLKKILTLSIFCTIFQINAQVQLDATGSANAFVVTYPAVIVSAPAGGIEFTFKANHSITGAATLNLNGTGAKPILKNFNKSLVANDIITGQFVKVIYDPSSGGIWQMLSNEANPSGNISGSGLTGAIPFWASGNTLSSDNANFYWDNTNKRLGVGTDTPSEKINVRGLNNQGLKIETVDASAGNAAIYFASTITAPPQMHSASIALKNTFGDKALQFFNETSTLGAGEVAYTFLDNLTNKIVSITNIGNVGIGTSNPNERLIVSGNTSVTGNSTISGTLVSTNARLTSLANGVLSVNGIGNVVLAPALGDNLGNHTATNTIKSLDGTVGAPSYTFNSNQTTGMYLINTNIIGIATNGTNRILYDGFGHSVTPPSANGYTINVGGAAAFGLYGTLNASASDAPNNGLVVSGNVGIGTSTPGQNLVVVGNTSVTGNSTVSGTVVSANSRITSLANGVLSVTGNGSVVLAPGGGLLSGSGTNGAVNFWTGTSTQSADAANFFWDKTNKRLGIGTNAPSGALEIKDYNITGGQTLDQQQNTVTFSSGAKTSMWQSFTAGITGFLTQVNVGFQNATGSGTLNIYNGEGTGGSLLYSNSISWTNSGCTTQNYLIPASTVFVTSGNKYTYEVVGTIAQAGCYANSVYAGGRNDISSVASYQFSTFVTPASNVTSFLIKNNQVVIGNTTPTASLDVTGSVRLRNFAVNGSYLTVDGLGNIGMASLATLGGPTGSGTNGAVNFWTGTSTQSADATNFFWDNTNKRLGIGTNAPVSKFQLSEAGANTVYQKFSNSNTQYTFGDGFDIGIGISGGAEIRQRENNTLDFYTNDQLRMILSAAGQLRITNLATSGAVFANTNGDLFVSTSTGANAWTINGTNIFPQNLSHKVGIGTSTPGQLLELYNANNSIVSVRSAGSGTNSSASLLLFTQATNTTDNLGTGSTTKGWEISGRSNAYTGQANRLKINFFDGTAWNEHFTLLPDGKLGIGALTPVEKLTVSDNAATALLLQSYVSGAAGASQLRLMKGRGTQASPTAVVANDVIGRISFSAQFDNTPAGFTGGFGIRAEAAEGHSATNHGGRLIFTTTPIASTIPQERMTIAHTGNIGIGTTAPGSTLEVFSPTSNAEITIKNGSGGLANLAIDANVNRASVEYLEAGVTKALNGWDVVSDYWYVFENGTVNLVSKTGNIGIKNTIPSEALDVTGNVEVTGEYKYATPKTRYKSLSSASFVVETNTYALNQAGSYANIITGTVGVQATLYANLDLPDNSTITGLQFYYVDNDATYGFGTVYINDINSNVGTTSSNSTASFLVTPTNATSANIASASDLSGTIVVDNDLRTYQVVVNTKQNVANLQIIRARIRYLVPNAD